ncbi:MAG: hypothetical protein ACXWNJ_13490 [Vulcanimicrobiaceae bacterium]
MLTDIIDLQALPHEKRVQWRIADVDVALEGPSTILDLVVGAYQRFPKRDKDAVADVTLRIVHENNQWHIFAGERYQSSLSMASGNANIAIQLANEIIFAVAERSRFLIMHAGSVERDGEVMCVAGPTFSGKTLLTAHLASRGWRILSDEYAFIEPRTGHVVPFPKLLYVRSSSLPLLPRSFRRAIEFSPWHGFGQSRGIAFAAVDPSHSYSDAVWSVGARLSKMLIVDGRSEERATVTDCDPWSIIPELNSLVWQPPDLLDGLSKLATALRGVRVGKLLISTPVETTNVIERWANNKESAVAAYA